MELKCKHCGNVWDYKGHSTEWAYCSKCHFLVRIKNCMVKGDNTVKGQYDKIINDAFGSKQEIEITEDDDKTVKVENTKTGAITEVSVPNIKETPKCCLCGSTENLETYANQLVCLECMFKNGFLNKDTEMTELLDKIDFKGL